MLKGTLGIQSVSDGEFTLLDSKTVLTTSAGPIEIVVKPNEESIFTFSFEFLDKEPADKLDFLTEIEGNLMKIKLYNFNSSIEAGNVQPWEVGTLSGNKNLYLIYRVRKIQESNTRSLEVSFYIKAKE